MTDAMQKVRAWWPFHEKHEVHITLLQMLFALEMGSISLVAASVWKCLVLERIASLLPAVMEAEMEAATAASGTAQEMAASVTAVAHPHAATASSPSA